jgi:hypothetical protein
MKQDRRNDPDYNKTRALYAVLGIAIVLSLVPNFFAAGLAAVGFFGVLIAAYIMRSGTPQDSFLRNHATHIIRMIWVSSAIATLTIIIASWYLLTHVDFTLATACIEKHLPADFVMSMDNPAALYEIFRPCMNEYIAGNLMVFIISGALVMGPVILYILWAFLKGYRRFQNGQAV